jgi:site-specific DNA-methyltransferase (adenine-specific)
MNYGGVRLLVGESLEVMRQMADDSVDLVVTSPPYEDARTYGIDFGLKGQAWVDWAIERFIECNRVSRGLVMWVVEGRTRKFQWSATPALMMADLHRRGVKLRKPPIFNRIGIPGSGGPDWWRNDYEFCICATKGKLPWSDNTATGKPPKYAPGGDPSHRTQDGGRVNRRATSQTRRKSDGSRPRDGIYVEPIVANPGNILRDPVNVYVPIAERNRVGSHRARRRANLDAGVQYVPPEKANPGNVIQCAVGGGKMGHALAHENEAPFSENLIEPFIRCFCPPDGIVLDPFCGSGTTAAVARKFGRRAIGIDIRDSQIELSEKRVFDGIYDPIQVA